MGARIRAVLISLILLPLTAACSDLEGPSVIDEGGFIAVSAGGEHSCGVIRTGAAYCWGSDAGGQLGTRAAENSPIPVRVDSDRAFVQISAGGSHTCAIDSGGELFCWGNNNFGQLGNNTTVTLPFPVIHNLQLRFANVTSGARHSCAWTAAGTTYCWGAGGQGQLGAGRFVSELAPVQVSGNVRFSIVSAGVGHTCGLALDGTPYCWGNNDYGQLGNGNIDNQSVPAAVSISTKFIDISAGENHSCGVDTQGIAYCWGASLYGELGTTVIEPGAPAATRPQQVFGGNRYLRISAGRGFTCAIVSNSGVQCWGRGLEGQLGNGQTQNWNTPQGVSTGFREFGSLTISAGGLTHACALTRQNAVFCWGRGQQGQLGNATVSYSPMPIRISTQ